MDERRLVKRNEFARMYGLAPQAIDKAVAGGEVIEEPRGIDSEEGAAAWLARRQRYRTNAEMEAKRAAAELQFLQAKIELETQAIAKEEAEWIDRREAQGN